MQTQPKDMYTNASIYATYTYVDTKKHTPKLSQENFHGEFRKNFFKGLVSYACKEVILSLCFFSIFEKKRQFVYLAMRNGVCGFPKFLFEQQVRGEILAGQRFETRRC